LAKSVFSLDYVCRLSYGWRSVVRITAAPVDAAAAPQVRKGNCGHPNGRFIPWVVVVETQRSSLVKECDRVVLALVLAVRSGQTRTPATLTTKPKNQRLQGSASALFSVLVGRCFFPGHTTYHPTVRRPPFSYILWL
jgi:hypothetical protein